MGLVPRQCECSIQVVAILDATLAEGTCLEQDLDIQQGFHVVAWHATVADPNLARVGTLDARPEWPADTCLGMRGICNCGLFGAVLLERTSMSLQS